MASDRNCPIFIRQKHINRAMAYHGISPRKAAALIDSGSALLKGGWSGGRFTVSSVPFSTFGDFLLPSYSRADRQLPVGKFGSAEFPFLPSSLSDGSLFTLAWSNSTKLHRGKKKKSPPMRSSNEGLPSFTSFAFTTKLDSSLQAEGDIPSQPSLHVTTHSLQMHTLVHQHPILTHNDHTLRNTEHNSARPAGNGSSSKEFSPPTFHPNFTHTPDITSDLIHSIHGYSSLSVIPGNES